MGSNDRLYKEVGAKIKKQLLSGIYKIGDKLPTERELTETFGVGRTVIREALILLEVEGFIEIRKSSGIYVIKNEIGMDSFLTGKVGPFELLQARQLIESTIAAFAATQIVKSDLEKLNDVLEQEKEYLDLPPNEELDRYFHCLVAGATQNALLTDLVRYIWDVRKRDPIWQELKQQDEQREYSQRGYEEHKAILQALQRKDPMAAKLAMWQHLENINDRVTKQLESKEPSFDRFLFESVPLDIKA